MRVRRFVILVLLLACVCISAASPIAAQPDALDPVHVVATNGGTTISWGEQAVSVDLKSVAAQWPTVAFGGLRVPAWLVPLGVPDNAALDLRLARADSKPWSGDLAVLADTAPNEPSIATVQPLDVAQLPDQPVTMLREGRLRGERIVVLAVSTLFQQHGVIRATTNVQATVPGATPFTDQDSNLLAMRGPFINGVPAPDPQANLPAILMRVTHAGLQRVSGAALANAGLDLGSLDPTRLHVRVRGLDVALELRGTTDGRLDADDELRFVATTPGDRWNSSDSYWLTVEATSGVPMGQRSVEGIGATVRTTALERGSWRSNQLYNPALPGSDGDHWFTSRLIGGPGVDPMATGMPLTPTLPLATGTTVVTITGSSPIVTDHTLAVTFSGATVQSSWSNWGDGAGRFTFDTSATTATVTLLPGSKPDRLDIDGINWERPVTLDLGGQGATFSGVTGNWTYQLAHTPAGATLYDVSDPLRATVLGTAPGGDFSFTDGPTARDYLLAGPGNIYTPEVSRHQPVDLASPQDADVVFIGPAVFHEALKPLVDLRTSQGHRVALIDTQSIYDTWSHGQIDPTAIRSFLRHAAATWQTAPAAILLVGDGTSDPRNYTRRNNTTFVPPYLAAVDPYQGVTGLTLGETACDTCYAQLDGDDPLSDSLPDLMLGRLPVKSVDELTKLVAKLVGYERSPALGSWRSRAVFISDNSIGADGTPDDGGDFFAYTRQSIALQPPQMQIAKLFYDPNPATSSQPDHEPDALRAYERTRALLSDGAAFVTYIGHSHEWQWANTDLAATPSYLLGLYDADDLTNGSQMPILLEMTCLTSAFQTPAFSGTTIDERLLLNPTGGAIAVWGSTGKGVSHGHDILQKGFYTKQWHDFNAGTPAPIGALVAAGYQTLFTQSGCCQDALRTFVLLGDPLTIPQVRFGSEVLLPVVRR